MKWDKVLKNGPSKICGREPLKNFNGYETDHISSNICKGCLPQNLLCPFLNTWTQMMVKKRNCKRIQILRISTDAFQLNLHLLTKVHLINPFSPVNPI